MIGVASTNEKSFVKEIDKLEEGSISSLFHKCWSIKSFVHIHSKIYKTIIKNGSCNYLIYTYYIQLCMQKDF